MHILSYDIKTQNLQNELFHGCRLYTRKLTAKLLANAKWANTVKGQTKQVLRTYKSKCNASGILAVKNLLYVGSNCTHAHIKFTYSTLSQNTCW